MLMAVKYVPGATRGSGFTPALDVVVADSLYSEGPQRTFTAYCNARCLTFGSSFGPMNSPRFRSLLHTRSSEARTLTIELPSSVMSRGFWAAGQLAGPGTPGAWKAFITSVPI